MLVESEFNSMTLLSGAASQKMENCREARWRQSRGKKGRASPGWTD
jgi:hypothetical protein